jgi:hypothetical protein
MAKSKKASQRGRKPFKRNVKNITKDLSKEEVIKEEPKKIILEKSVLNHNWVARTYGVSIEEAKELVKQANRIDE